ncbi:MAG: creatininase [Candidatus Eisenbacteria bacterium RBG_16_71_46]|nr:MAG: creatininase [Candidatus Eisenbacteria bacterium RBG_16_71_46]OGF24467.1 MAG: creatininase [Candidatus Eisenbacteria bacterium RBG_19FT_COMBO_70_11]
MRIADLNWMQVESLVAREDRAVLPVGSIEQHAYLSLATDAILAERLAIEAAEPLGVPVFPVLAYGITPAFRAYPGTVSLRTETLAAVLTDVLDSLAGTGFRRVLVANGHGGNQPVLPALEAWQGAHAGVRVRFHSWWNAPRVWAEVQCIDPQASHASWMESFPWTRLAGVEPPSGAKPMIDSSRIATMTPQAVREFVGDGNFGGRYQRPDDEMRAVWAAAVAETRSLLEQGWG